MRRPDRRRAKLVARTELRRTNRKLQSTTRGVLILIGGGIAVFFHSLLVGGVAYWGGEFIRGADPSAIRLLATAAFVGLLALVGFTTLQHAVQTACEPDGIEGLLTTIAYEDALAGLVLAELCRVLLVLGLPLVALGLGLTAGGAGIGVGVGVLLGAVLVAALGTTAGFGGGLVVKLVANRSAFVARRRASVGAVASMLIPIGWMALTVVSTSQRFVLRLATHSPVAWVGDILLVARGSGGGYPMSATVAAGTTIAAIPAGASACLWLAGRAWYADPIQPSHEFDPEERSLSDRLLDGRVGTATKVVAQKSWRRGKRAPITVQFAVVPYFFLVYQLQMVILKGIVPPTLPLTAGLASAAAAGAAFTLNPLGGEEGVLPLTLTADVSGRAFVTGLVLAGAAPGTVLTTGLVGGLGIAAGTPPLALGGALATAVVATVTAPAIAVGTGVVFPKFESSSVQGRDIVVPSTWAFSGYFLALGTAVAPAILAFLLYVRGFFHVTVGSEGLIGGFATTVLLCTAAGVAGFLYASNRVATYRLD